MRKDFGQASLDDQGANDGMMCELCGREVENVTHHHLIPRSENGGGTPRIAVCLACHGMIHRLFSNTDLARQYSEVSSLKKQREMQRFLRWVKKQDPHKKIRIR